MLLSLYPTDPPEVRDAVVEQARGLEQPLFTSLHLPEAGPLHRFLDELRTTELPFWADVSPATLEMLDLDDLTDLAPWGVVGVRIDYGFTVDQIRRVAQDLPVAVNASTITVEELDALDGLDIVGWHNFYPRPETGLSVEHYRNQSALFTERGLPLYTFVPGEMTQRAPLHLGLPTVEEQRHVNTWTTWLQLRRWTPSARIVCAEGTVDPDHASWIRHAETTGEITIPLAELADDARYLLEGSWRIRAEQSGVSQRLEGTRGHAITRGLPRGRERSIGALVADGPNWKRYEGEVHLMCAPRPLDPDQVHIGQIASAYTHVAQLVAGHDRVRFIRI